MLDRKGQTIAVGDHVYVVTEEDRGLCWVRKIGENECRIDDGNQEDTDLETSKSWHWSAWVSSPEIEKIKEKS